MELNTMDVSIIGASGYAGGELLRILLLHPHVRIKQVLGLRSAGCPVTRFHPNLRGLTSLTIENLAELKSCDVLFVALPNGASQQTMPEWMSLSGRIIDMGADFRLGLGEDWEQWYHQPHAAPELMQRFLYGVPEINRDQVRKAQHVAIPGCEAIVSILCIYPLLQAGLINPRRIIIDAKMSSSQAGNTVTAASHHPERAGAVRSYQPVGHRHTVEIERCLESLASDIHVHISATAIEMVRGILVTIHTESARADLSERNVWQAFRSAYSEDPFVRIVKQKHGLYRYPEPKLLQGTNFCEIGFALDPRGGRLVVMGAIDNLVKGTSGTAVQCMNLMAGFPETTGLEFPGLHPV